MHWSMYGRWGGEDNCVALNHEQLLEVKPRWPRGITVGGATERRRRRRSATRIHVSACSENDGIQLIAPVFAAVLEGVLRRYHVSRARRHTYAIRFVAVRVATKRPHTMRHATRIVVSTNQREDIIDIFGSLTTFPSSCYNLRLTVTTLPDCCLSRFHVSHSTC